MIGYKLVAVINGEYRSVFDGSRWEIGVERHGEVKPHHKGGLYVYDNEWEARFADFPRSSKYARAEKALLECECRGKWHVYRGYLKSTADYATPSYTYRYYEIGRKYAFEYVKPIREVE